MKDSCNRQRLLCDLGGILLLVISHHSAALGAELVDISITASGQAQTVLCLNESATFTAQHNCTVPASGAVTYTWSGAFSGSGQSVTRSFGDTGSKTATVDVSYTTTEGATYVGQGSVTFVVVKVVSISPASRDTCLELTSTFQITTDPVDKYERVNLTATGATLLSFNQTTGSGSVKFDQLCEDASDEARKTVTATCGTSAASARIRVSQFTGISRVLASDHTVCAGSTVQFQIAVEPEGYYPAILGLPSHASFDTSTGILSYTFSQASEDPVPLTLTCGPNPVSISTTVISMGSIGASCTKIGANGGTAELSVNPIPSTRTVEWQWSGEEFPDAQGNSYSAVAGEENGTLVMIAKDSEIGTCSSSIQLEVVGACDSNDVTVPPDLAFAGGGTQNCGGELAQFEIPAFADAINYSFTACHYVDTWYARLESIGFKYYGSVCCGNRAPVDSAESVANSDWCDDSNGINIIDDLSPPATYAKYCVESCLGEFVEAAADAFEVITWEALAPSGGGESAIEAVTTPFNCLSASTVSDAKTQLQSGVNAALEDLYSDIVNRWESQLTGTEQAAYAAEDACLGSLVGEIEERAFNLNWTCP